MQTFEVRVPLFIPQLGVDGNAMMWFVGLLAAYELMARIVS